MGVYTKYILSKYFPKQQYFMTQHLSELNHQNFCLLQKEIEKLLFYRRLHCLQIYKI